LYESGTIDAVSSRPPHPVRGALPLADGRTQAYLDRRPDCPRRRRLGRGDGVGWGCMGLAGRRSTGTAADADHEDGEPPAADRRPGIWSEPREIVAFHDATIG
jgi:hypothetical protein